MTKIEYCVIAAMIAILLALLVPAFNQAADAPRKMERAYHDGYFSAEAGIDAITCPDNWEDAWKKGYRDAKLGKQKHFRFDDIR